MRQFNVLFRWGWTFLVAVTLAIGLAGCDGDDGAAGAAGAAGPIGGTGPAGPAGPPGPGASITPLESCAVCHDDGSFADATEFHALPPRETVSGVTFAEAAPTLSISFDVAVDGVASDDYNDLQRIYVTDGTTRVSIADFGTLTSNGGGNYTVDIDTVAAGLDTAVPSRYVVRAAIDGDRETRAYVVGDYPSALFAQLVSDQACQACHGAEGESIHFASQMSATQCLVCHGSDGRPKLSQVVHGYHSGIKTWRDPIETTDITYPTNMSNCSVCHSEDAQLAAANAMPVSGEGCFSCHGSMVNVSWDFTGLGFHLTLPDPETANCGLCHGDNPETPEIETGIARANVAAFHNDKIMNAGDAALLGNDGVLWNGEDLSVTEGAKFDWRITNVADDTTNLAVTWQASYDGTPVNVCNDTVAAGPVFHVGRSEGDIRIYRNYAQGDDFILGPSTTGAGQPARDVDVTVDNTDCVDGVATTIFPVEATDPDVDVDVGRLALNGKPLVVSPAPEIMPTMVARAKTPTYDWLVGLGGPAPDRRAVVDTGKCVGCHVGTLYQHGGDRVDNVDTCLVCHNAAANERYARAGYGVDASEAYDGKAGEAFEMKTMIHRIHSANYEFPDGRYNSPYLVYRGRGIYAFARDESDVPNWPGDGDDLPVFGSEAGDLQDHHFHAPTYPRSLNECTACHTEDDPDTTDVNEAFTVIPDQTKAMASTTDTGSTDWDDRIDDVLQGAATTACVTCHADGASKGHAYQNSWTPQAFPEGRQTIIDAN